MVRESGACRSTFVGPEGFSSPQSNGCSPGDTYSACLLFRAMRVIKHSVRDFCRGSALAGGALALHAGGQTRPRARKTSLTVTNVAGDNIICDATVTTDTTFPTNQTQRPRVPMARSFRASA